MDRLWAPWRMNYIRQANEVEDEECFICKAIEHTSDRNNLVVAEFSHVIILLNKYPYNNGHIMIAPKKHLSNIKDMDNEIKLELMNCISISTNILEQVLNAEGFNIGINMGRVAGAGVPDHLHIHIVPRWNGDTNYMPIISDTKIISQSIEEAYTILKKAFTEYKDGI
jgi:ATP adenylyltransferase